MSMTMIAAIGGAGNGISQFAFLGVNDWAIADAATLNLLASGSTTTNLVAGTTGAFAAPGVFLGISPPNTTGETSSFAFQINANTGEFTTYPMPSGFAYASGFSGAYTPILSSASDVWVGIGATLINLSQICGLVSGGTALIDVRYDTPVSIAYITDTSVWTPTTYGELYQFSLSNEATENIYSYPFSGSLEFGCVVSNLIAAYYDGIIYLNDIFNMAAAYTVSSSGMITPEAMFGFGNNLFLLNYTNNQAQSINVTNPAAPAFSPVFPLDLSPNGDAPAFSWMDYASGVYYQNLAGASLFANLSPMQF